MRSHRKWTNLAVVVFAFTLPLLIAACRRPSARSTEQVYSEAWLSLKRGDLNDAQQKADQELRRFTDSNTEWHWEFRTLKAEVLLRKRLNQQALDLLQPAVPEFLVTSDVAVWQRLTQASASGYLFEFSDASRFLSQANDIASRYHPELLGEVALRRGTLQFLQGNTQGAQQAYRTALAIARKQGDRFLETAALGSLGLIATREEHYDESIQFNRAALELSRSVGAQGSEPIILGNTAWGLFELGDFDGSLSLFEQAQQSAEKEANPGVELGWTVDVGALNFYLRDYASAENELRQALELAKRLNQKSQVGAALDVLASVALKQGRTEAAESYDQQALAQFRAIGYHAGEVSSELTEAQIAAERPDGAADAERILSRVLREPNSEASTHWLAEARLAKVYANEGKSTDAERQFQHAIATVESARRSVQEEDLRLSFLANAIEFYDDYVDFLVAQHRTDDALELATQTRAQTLTEGLQLNRPVRAHASVELEQAAQRERVTILTYWLGERHSYLWAVSSDGELHFFTLPAKSEIDTAVKSYTSAVQGPRDPLSTRNEDGARLFEMLVLPAIAFIPKGSRVVVIPDGSLFGLNFETLPVESAAPHYWIDDVTVVDASSPMFISTASRTSRRARGKALLIGDPLSPSADFPPLPNAGVEISDIEKHFSSADVTLISGKNATPKAYADSQPGKFSYIHFVAHGTSSVTVPLDSAVILSRQGDSFKLYGRDIVNLPLDGALVTISACHGVGMRNYSGEGLVGLSWAFLRAGASAVVAALWEVDDASTATLMDHFYDQLSKGVAPAEALRKAKLSLLHSGTVYSKPFYWAPFQYYAGA